MKALTNFKAQIITINKRTQKKKILLVGLATWLLILGVAGMACATPVEWELTFDSTAGNVANSNYVFSVDTEKNATKTYENNNPITVTTPWPNNYFYAEYVSKNGVQKGFNYLTFSSEDKNPYDWNLATYSSPTWLHIETFEDNSNVLYLNLYFDSNDFGSDFGKATSVYIRDVDGGQNYAANVSKDHFTLAKSDPVPEPATILLLCSGLAGLAGFKKKLRKNKSAIGVKSALDSC